MLQGQLGVVYMDKMKIFLISLGSLMIFLLLQEYVFAALWVTNPSSCPSSDGTNFPGQNCAPQNICGDSSGTAQCYTTSTLVAPSSLGTSTTDQDSNTSSAGWIVNCYATADASEPFCDNSGAFWCDRNATCQAKHTQTNCTASVFAQAVCGNCISPYFACDGSVSDSDGCEIQGTSSCGSATGTIIENQCFSATAGNCTRSSDYLDCDNNDADDNQLTCNSGNGCEVNPQTTTNNTRSIYQTCATFSCQSGYLDCNGDGNGNSVPYDGCEITVGGACTVGALSGTYGSSCSGTSGQCIVPKKTYITGNRTEYSTNATETMLWYYDYGTNNLLNASNFNYNKSFGINASGFPWSDSLLSCTALETNSKGQFLCGVDDTGGGGGEFSSYINISLLDNASIIRAQNTSWITNNQNVNTSEQMQDSSGNMAFNSSSVYMYYNDASNILYCELNVSYFNANYNNTLVTYVNSQNTSVTLLANSKLPLAENISLIHDINTSWTRNLFIGSKNISYDSTLGQYYINVSIGADGNTDDVSNYVNFTKFDNATIIRTQNTSWITNNQNVNTTEQIQDSIGNAISNSSSIFMFYLDASNLFYGELNVSYFNLNYNNTLVAYVNSQNTSQTLLANTINSNLSLYTWTANASMKVYADSLDANDLTNLSDANLLKLNASNITTVNLTMPFFSTCDLKTDSSGNFYCGTDAQSGGGASKGSVQPLYNDSDNYYFNYSGINESVKQTILANVTNNFILDLIGSIISSWINTNITMIQDTHYNNTKTALYFQNKSELGTAMQNDTLLRLPNMSLFLQNSSNSGSANVSIDSAGRIYINTSLGGSGADPNAIYNDSVARLNSLSVSFINTTRLNVTLNSTFNSYVCYNANCSRATFVNGSDFIDQALS